MARSLPGPREQYPLRDLISAEPPDTEMAAEVSGNVLCIRRTKSPLLPVLPAGFGVPNVFPHLPPAHASGKPVCWTKWHTCSVFTLLRHLPLPPNPLLCAGWGVLEQTSWTAVALAQAINIHEQGGCQFFTYQDSEFAVNLLENSLRSCALWWRGAGGQPQSIPTRQALLPRREHC